MRKNYVPIVAFLLMVISIVAHPSTGYARQTLVRYTEGGEILKIIADFVSAVTTVKQAADSIAYLMRSREEICARGVEERLRPESEMNSIKTALCNSPLSNEDILISIKDVNPDLAELLQQAYQHPEPPKGILEISKIPSDVRPGCRLKNCADGNAEHFFGPHSDVPILFDSKAEANDAPEKEGEFTHAECN